MVEAMAEKTESGTITLKKNDLWRYSTFLLLLVVLVGAFFVFRGSSGAANVTNTGSNQQQGVVDLSVFSSNPDLYPSLGPSDAKNVVIEFSDFQCPFCAMASGLPSWVSQAQAQYGDLINSAKNVEALASQGKLRFIYVPMSFLGAESGYAAEAGYCANEQGKFWEMHDAIFTAQTQGENTGKYNKDKLEVLAQTISGLDQSKFKTCLESGKYTSAVQTAAGQASTAASATPTFYVNGKQVSASWNAIQSALQ